MSSRFNIQKFDVEKFLKSRKRWEDFVEVLVDSDHKCKSYRMLWRKIVYILTDGKIRIPIEDLDLYMTVVPSPDTICRALRRVRERRPDLKLPKESADRRRFLSTILHAYYSNKQTKLDGWEQD